MNPKSFKYEYYDELIKIIIGHWHSYSEGDLNIHLSDRQKAIVNSDNKRIRIKGVAGCGKTQVVANRAVEQQLKTGEKILIITGQLQKSVDVLGGGLTKIYCQVVYEERNKVCTFAT